MSKTIVIDAGHGGKDPGACGNGLQEKDIVLSAALKLGERLKASGFNVLYTRETDIFIELANRAKTANNVCADLFISLHCNAAENMAAKGIETLVYKNTGENKKVAELIQKELISQFNTPNRGIKERPDVVVLNSTAMTAVLIEMGFITNSEDAAVFKTGNFYTVVTEAISRAICTYFVIENKVELVPSNTTVISATNVPDWQEAAFGKLIEKGIIKTPEYWQNKLSDKITVGEMFAVIANL